MPPVSKSRAVGTTLRCTAVTFGWNSGVRRGAQYAGGHQANGSKVRYLCGPQTPTARAVCRLRKANSQWNCAQAAHAESRGSPARGASRCDGTITYTGARTRETNADKATAQAGEVREETRGARRWAKQAILGCQDRRVGTGVARQLDHLDHAFLRRRSQLHRCSCGGVLRCLWPQCASGGVCYLRFGVYAQRPGLLR